MKLLSTAKGTDANCQDFPKSVFDDLSSFKINLKEGKNAR